MRSLLAALLALVCFGSPCSPAASVDFVTNWPGYLARQPRDSHPTDRATYVLTDSTLVVVPTAQGSNRVSKVLTLGLTQCSRVESFDTNVLLVAGADGFLLVDISEPLQPLVRTVYSLKGWILGTIDCLVYFNDRESQGIDVIDCSDLARPVLAGRLPGPFSGTIQGINAYGTTASGEFEIWSLAGRTNRAVLSSLAGPFGARRVYRHNNTAYLLPYSLALGIDVIDISDPASPKSAGRVVTGGSVYDLALEGTTGWIADADRGLFKVDLSDLSVSAVPGADLGFLPESIRFFQGSLYIADESGLALQRFEVKNDTVRLVERIPVPQPIEAISVTGQTAIVSGGNGIAALDISRPKDIRELSRLDLGGRVSGLAVVGKTAFAVTGSRLVAIDISDPHNLTLLSENGGEPIDPLFYTFAAAGNVVYVATFQGLVVYDMSDSARPRPVATNAIGSAFPLHVNGNYLYASRPNQAPTILNVSDPLQPTVIGSFEMAGATPTWCGFAQDGAVLVVSANYISGFSSASLLFYDVADPAHPRLLGWGPETKVLSDMQVRMGTLYYVSSARVRAYDLSKVDPSSIGISSLDVPLVAEAVDFDRNFGPFALARGHLLITEAGAGLSVWAAHLAPKLGARRATGGVALDFQLDPAFTYGLETTTNLNFGWEGMGNLLGDPFTLPIAPDEPARFFRLNELGPTPETFPR